MRILIGTTNPSQIAYFEMLLADADAAFVPPRAARREGWPLDSLSLDPEGVSFLDARRRTSEQMEKPCTTRLKAFLGRRWAYDSNAKSTLLGAFCVVVPNEIAFVRREAKKGV